MVFQMKEAFSLSGEALQLLQQIVSQLVNSETVAAAAQRRERRVRVGGENRVIAWRLFGRVVADGVLAAKGGEILLESLVGRGSGERRRRSRHLRRVFLVVVRGQKSVCLYSVEL